MDKTVNAFFQLFLPLHIFVDLHKKMPSFLADKMGQWKKIVVPFLKAGYHDLFIGEGLA